MARLRAEVAEKLAKALSDRSSGLVFEGDNVRLGEYLDAWLADSVKNRVRRGTYVRYEGIVRNHITPTLGRIKLKALTPADVRRLYNDKLEAGLSARSVNYIHVTLHKALKQALLDGMIPRNVTETVKAPQSHRKEVAPLSLLSGLACCLRRPLATAWKPSTCSPSIAGSGRASCLVSSGPT